MNGHEGAWRVPGYTEVRELGTGGSGRVVLARRAGDDFPVAIKYLSDELRADLGFVARFRHEARLLAILRSPHAARLYEYVEGAGGAAIIMELVDGVSLRRLLASQGPTGPEAALVVLKGALLGLSAAHVSGLVHRDFKPENVIVDAEGNSKLVDFGVAVRVGDDVGGAGTPSYMAPEQWSGAPATPATDVYAATIVFFECLTGTRPFRADTVAAIARHHQVTPPPVEQVPEPLRGLVEHGMAKHPADRPHSADAFLAELEAVAGAYGPDWEERGRRRLARLAGLLGMLFPLGEPAPDANTALAQTRLRGDGGAAHTAAAGKKLAFKVAIGAGVVAAVAGATAIVVGTVNGARLTASSSSATPGVTLTMAPTESAEPDPLPTEEDLPEETPTPEPGDPTPTATVPGDTTAPLPTATKSSSPKPSPTATKSRTPPSTRPSTRPSATPTRSTATPEPELTSTKLPGPNRTTITAAPTSARPTATAAPPTTRRPIPTRTAPTATATATSTPGDGPTPTEEPTLNISAADPTTSEGPTPG
ncbi:protein kinase [Thermopolyspora sp. NPDC052614]|uniref:serine/threonine-protein kinase n=1 Tax=Thermopolyspora sp. NPDC052614 TaxID=3155682 RepID=UPI003425D654